MKYKIVDLNKEQTQEIDEQLEDFNVKYIGFEKEGSASVGIIDNGKLIAGAFGCMTVYSIFYVETVFVQKEYRNQGIGAELMKKIEEKAKELGANMIRLDTFDWQGKEFYPKLGYQQVGSYESKEDNFSEYFFVKSI